MQAEYASKRPLSVICVGVQLTPSGCLDPYKLCDRQHADSRHNRKNRFNPFDVSVVEVRMLQEKHIDGAVSRGKGHACGANRQPDRVPGTMPIVEGEFPLCRARTFGNSLS